ncbi:6649_t:CDS:2, partial [Racocetra fulgida]
MPSNLSTTLLDDIARLYIDADDYNVIITAGQGDEAKVFKAHTVILRSRSSYFRVALSSNWAKKIPSQYNHGFHTQCDALYFNKPNISPKSLTRFYIVPGIKPPSYSLPPRIAQYSPKSKIGFNGLHAALIANWINHEDNEIPTTSLNITHKFKLLLRGSKDGRGVVTFHDLCDFKGATIVLIKIMGTGELIGGYNPNSWTSSDRYVRTTESFIFSLGNNTQDLSNYVLSRVKFAEFAIRDSSADNTSIGFGNDLLWFEGKNDYNSINSNRTSASSKSSLFDDIEIKQHLDVYGTCKECQSPKTSAEWCRKCNSDRFRESFGIWSSGNKDIDNFISTAQLNAIGCSQVLEWIPWERFSRIKNVGLGRFGSTYSASWIDGYITHWDNRRGIWGRCDSGTKFTIKVIQNSSSNISDFLNEHPITRDYALVIRCLENDFRSYLYKQIPFLEHDWKTKLEIIADIALILHRIHESDSIHRNFHTGNILRQMNSILITDLNMPNLGDDSPTISHAKNRPEAEEVYIWVQWWLDLCNDSASDIAAEFNIADQEGKLKDGISWIHPEAIYTPRYLEFQTLPEPENFSPETFHHMVAFCARI